MKLEASYTINDLVELARKNLEAKGFTVAGEPAGDEYKHYPTLTLAIEQLGQAIAPAAQQPAKAEAKPKTAYELSEKRQEVLRKARAKYAEKKKAEKQATLDPTITATYGKEFQDRVLAEINELKEQPQQEVVAPTTSPFQVSELFSANGLSIGKY